MTLSDRDIEEFTKILKEETGQEVSSDEAHELAHRFLACFKVVYRPIPKE